MKTLLDNQCEGKNVSLADKANQLQKNSIKTVPQRAVLFTYYLSKK